MDSDAGDYRCVVQNEAGTDSAVLALEVGCKKLVFTMLFLCLYLAHCPIAASYKVQQSSGS